MKIKKEDKQQYDKLVRMVNRAEKKAIEFVRKNLDSDPELRLSNTSTHRLTL
jgi:hypothetical protein